MSQVLSLSLNLRSGSGCGTVVRGVRTQEIADLRQLERGSADLFRPTVPPNYRRFLVAPIDWANRTPASGASAATTMAMGDTSNNLPISHATAMQLATATAATTTLKRNDFGGGRRVSRGSFTSAECPLWSGLARVS
jgi:hypothetical protein